METEEKNQDFPNVLYRYVYLGRISPFDNAFIPRKEEKVNQIAELSSLQRAIGIVEGVLKKYDSESCRGEIEVQGSLLSFHDVRTRKKRKKQGELSEFIEQSIRFSFWPTEEDITSRNLCLKISAIRRNKRPSSGYVEVIGRLEETKSDSFVVSIWAKPIKRCLYVHFSGQYPHPDHTGKFVWVIGQLDPREKTIKFQETHVIDFVPEEEAKKIIEDYKARKASEPKTQKPKDLSTELNKETERAMINAKLKIVLKELPNNIQEINKLVWIPLENQAKSVPGGIELSSTPVNLLATKKMWNKAKEKADSLENPIYVIEAVIGFREGKFTAVASGIQVMQGKTKQQDAKE